MELTMLVGLLAAVLPVAYGAPTEAAANLTPQVLAAMKRDLGLDAREANARVTREMKAAKTIESLKETAGASFAGSWLDADSTEIKVAVTDKAMAEKITAAGATPVVVSNSYSKLQDAHKEIGNIIDSKASRGQSIGTWYVDVTTNKVVITALKAGTSEAAKIAAEAGLSESEFEVSTVSELPQTFIQGGEAYFINNSARCSVGFAVGGGFVTAGHCGTQGSSATDPNGGGLGSFAGSIFPGNDMAFVSGAGVSPSVYGYGGPDQPIYGSNQAPVGSSVCRSGSTTGVYCGTVQAFDVAVSYPQGTVYSTTQTNVCAEPGDSGGSFFTGGDAQGVTSGGSGNCASGGTTFFQPVNPILSQFGVGLSTA